MRHIRFHYGDAWTVFTVSMITITSAIAAYIAWDPYVVQAWSPSGLLSRLIVFLMQLPHPELLRGMAGLYVLSGIDGTIGLLKKGGDNGVVVELLEDKCCLQLDTGNMIIRREELQSVNIDRWGFIEFRTYDSSFKRRLPGRLRRKYPLLSGHTVVGFDPSDVRDVVDLWRTEGLKAALALYEQLGKNLHEST